MPPLSSTLERFQPSAISQIFSLAARLKEAGEEIADFSTGEPDFETPDHIKRAAIEAINRGETRYTAVDGTTILKEAIAEKFRRDNKLDYDPGQIFVHSGAKPLLADIFRTMLDPGDEVIVPTPCWPSHPGAILAAGGRPVFVRADVSTGYRIDAAQLEAAITPRTRALVLCSPSNPTGAAYGAEDLETFAEVLLKYPDVWVVTDDLYEHVVFDDFPFATIAAVAPPLKERTITVNGVSKAYAMTGWRIGYAGLPEEFMAGLLQLASQTTGNPSSMGQAAAIAALTGPQDFLQARAQAFERRRDKALMILNQVDGLTCSMPEGAFYLFPDCRKLFGRSTPAGARIDNSTDLCRYLLEDWKVATVPGSAFEAEGGFRISIAVSDAELERGCMLIRQACAALD
ncbi:MAG: pyridoxal phosphate-dependent aminotransferase [Pseudomonadota bacterium]